MSDRLDLDAPRGHMLLMVELDEGPHVVDVGFGGLTPTGVLRLASDLEQETPHERFRIVEVGRDDNAMQAEIGDEWATLYRFSLQEQVQSDNEVTNWYLSNHTDSHFLHGIVVARPSHGCRYSLRNDTLRTHHRDGRSETRVLATVDDLIDTLNDIFLLRVPATETFRNAMGSVVARR